MGEDALIWSFRNTNIKSGYGGGLVTLGQGHFVNLLLVKFP